MAEESTRSFCQNFINGYCKNGPLCQDSHIENISFKEEKEKEEVSVKKESKVGGDGGSDFGRNGDTLEDWALRLENISIQLDADRRELKKKEQRLERKTKALVKREDELKRKELALEQSMQERQERLDLALNAVSELESELKEREERVAATQASLNELAKQGKKKEAQLKEQKQALLKEQNELIELQTKLESQRKSLDHQQAVVSALEEDSKRFNNSLKEEPDDPKKTVRISDTRASHDEDSLKKQLNNTQHQLTAKENLCKQQQVELARLQQELQTLLSGSASGSAFRRASQRASSRPKVIQAVYSSKPFDERVQFTPGLRRNNVHAATTRRPASAH